jgi:hypothetical protein
MAWGATPQAMRTAAAQKAVGAPKAAQPRFLNKGSGKMETAAKMKAFKAPTKQMPRANPHPNHPGQSQAAHAGPVNPETKSLLELNPAQIAQRGTHMAQLQQKAEIAPLQGQAKELSGTEAAAQARFKALGEAQSTNLQGIGQQAENSAKTNENRAAELALQTGKSVETAGQAEAGQLGGYVSPELKAQMLAAGQRASETTGATQGLAAQSGQNEVNYMANLRASAAAKVTEGSRQIAAPYGKSLAENAAKQRESIAKTAPNAAKYQQELGKEAFNQKATQLGLGLKNSELGLKTGKLGVEKQNAATGAFKAKTGAQTAAEKLGLEGRKQSFGEWATKEKVAISQLSATDKARYDEAQIRVKEAAAQGKTPSPKEGRSYESKLSTAESIAKGILGNVNQGRGNAALQAKAREELRAKGASSDVIAAAMNLAVYHRLSTADQAAALSYGMTEDMRKEWFRKAPRGKK